MAKKRDSIFTKIKKSFKKDPNKIKKHTVILPEKAMFIKAKTRTSENERY